MRWEPENWKLENLKLENFENIKNDPWDMLNNFSFQVYAQKSLFKKLKNCNEVFFDIIIITLSNDIRVPS